MLVNASLTNMASYCKVFPTWIEPRTFLFYSIAGQVDPHFMFKLFETLVKLFIHDILW